MSAPKIMVAYEVPEDNEQWELPEEDMPETAWHDAIIDVLKLILREWASRVQARALVAGNLALRWNAARWKVGVDPDVSVYIPPPPEGEDTSSVCTWEPGHHPPRVAVEVVSRSTAAKDYVTGPDQYAASGATELWVFDPKRVGPRAHGGPFILQVWRRDDAGTFRQLYRGPGPVRSPELGAWLVVTDGGMRLRLADDAEGTHLWPTPEEREAIEHQRAEAERERAEAEHQRAEAERQRAEAERERAEAKLASLTDEIAALRAELARQRGG